MRGLGEWPGYPLRRRQAVQSGMASIISDLYQNFMTEGMTICGITGRRSEENLDRNFGLGVTDRNQLELEATVWPSNREDQMQFARSINLHVCRSGGVMRILEIANALLYGSERFKWLIGAQFYRLLTGTQEGGILGVLADMSGRELSPEDVLTLRKVPRVIGDSKYSPATSVKGAEKKGCSKGFIGN